MRSGRWLINLALVALIGLFAFLGYHGGRQTDTDSSGGIFEFGAEQVKRLEVRTESTAFALRRERTAWQLEQPVQWPADRASVERLLQITKAESDSGFAAENRDLAQFGLAQPSGELLLDDTPVVFGVTHNIGERRYTRIGSTIYLLPDIYLPFMLQAVESLVDRRLLPPSLALQSLKLDGFELTRADDGQWQAHNQPGLTPEWVQRRIANWRNLEASRVRSLATGAAPKQSVHATLESGTSLEFQVLSVTPEIVIAHPRLGVQFHFPEDHYPKLLSPPDEINS
jgi:hypothetical protein